MEKLESIVSLRKSHTLKKSVNTKPILDLFAPLEKNDAAWIKHEWFGLLLKQSKQIFFLRKTVKEVQVKLFEFKQTFVTL